MGSRYGSDAMGGVVNIITKKVTDTWSSSIGLETTLPTSSKEGDQAQADVQLSGPLIQDKLGIQLWGYASGRDEDKILGGQNQFKSINGTARLWFTPNKDNDIILEYQQQDQDYKESKDKSASGDTTKRDYSKEILTLAHTGRWENLTSEVSYTYDKSKRNASTQDNKTGKFVEDQWRPETKNQLLEANLFTSIGTQHVVSFGGTYKKEDLSLGGQAVEGSESCSKDRTRIDASVSQWSLFAEDEWRLHDRFNLTLGLRYDDNEIFGNHLSPRIYGVWQVNDTWTLKSGVATGFKAPSMREYNPDFGNPQRGDATTWGNPDLDSETSLNKEIGVYFDNGGPFTGNITVFHTDYKDKIANTGSKCLTAPNGEPTVNVSGNDCWAGKDGKPMSVYFNVPKAVMQGVELSGRWEITPQWALKGTWTFVDSKMKTENISVYGFPLSQADGLATISTPKHVGSLRLDWKMDDRFSTYSRLSYRGEDNQGVNWGSGSAPMNESAGDLLTYDVGGSWQITPTISLNMAMLNLFDQRVYDPDVTTNYQYIEEGRRFWAGMRMNF